MAEPLPEELRNAAGLVKSGQSEKARTILAAYVQQHPDSVDAWFLLSYVAPRQELQIECLNRALRLNPDHTEARTRLNKLSAPPTPPAAPAPPEKKLPFEEIARAYDRISHAPPSPASPPLAAQSNEGPKPRPAGQSSSQFGQINEGDRPAESSTTPFSTSASGLFDYIGPESVTPEFLQKAPFVTAPTPIESESDQSQAIVDRPKIKIRKKFNPRWILIPVESIGVIGLIAGLLYLNTIRPGVLFAYSPQSSPTLSHDLSNPPTPINTPMITFTMTVTQTQFLTVTPSVTYTLTPTDRPTRTPSATPTIVPVPPSAAQYMDLLQKQVAIVRGLPAGGAVDRTLITQSDAIDQLSSELLTKDYLAVLKNESRVLSVLGLVDTGYDLSSLILNQQVNTFNGIYLSWRKEIIAMGLNFSAIEHYGFVEAYENSLIYQAYKNNRMGIGPGCSLSDEHCLALNALYRGDSALLMYQWAKKYAAPEDVQATNGYNPGQLAFPESNPPAFTIQTNRFAFSNGYLFVKALFDKGGWAAVNTAFKNATLTTQQILHPSDYFSKKAPVNISIPDYSSSIGSNWQLLDSNTLGEWNTYLLLGYGTNVKARLDDTSAAAAAAGWAGDTYQVYTNSQNSKYILVVKWAWNTVDEGSNFHQSMYTHLQNLYQGQSENDQDHGSCWLAPDQISCLYTIGKQSIWIVAPDQVVFTTLLKQFPDFP